MATINRKYVRTDGDYNLEAAVLENLAAQLEQEELPGIFAKHYSIGNKVIGVCTNHLGNKLACYQELRDVSGAGYDLVASNVNNLTAEYLRPLLFVNCLQMNTMDEATVAQFGEGVRKACKEAGIVVAHTDIVRLPHQIKDETFSCTGMTIGTEYREIHSMWIERRANIRAGRDIVGMTSDSICCDGIEFTRALYEKMGRNETVSGSDRTLIEKLTMPTHLYGTLIPELRSLVDFFAPVTTGGYANLDKVLPRNIDAVLTIPDVPPIFQLIQDKLYMDEKMMYSTFNMGFGMLLGTKFPEAVIDKCRSNQVQAQIIGKLRTGNGNVLVNGYKLSGI